MKKKLYWVFLITDKYPPFRVDIRVLFGKEMIQRGHNIDWVMRSEKDQRSMSIVEWSGCTVWLGGMDTGTKLINKLCKQLLGFVNDIRILGLIKRNNYDFVQVKDKVVIALIALVAARVKKVKFFYWQSFPFPEMFLHRAEERNSRYPLLDVLRGRLFRYLLYKIIMPRSDHIFVQSDKMRLDVIAYGVSSDKVSAVPMGVDLDAIPEEVSPVALEDANGVDIPVLLYLGTLTRDRKLDFLIRVLSIVRATIPDARLYFVGAGDTDKDEAYLRSKAKELGVDDSVIFTGFLPMEEAWRYVKRADVCYSPFLPTPILDSTSPTKLIEYMAMNKPVVANNHPDQSNVIQSSGAGISVPYDESEFAQETIKLLLDKSYRDTISRNGRVYVEKNRSYRAIADRLESIYMKLMEK